MPPPGPSPSKAVSSRVPAPPTNSTKLARSTSSALSSSSRSNPRSPPPRTGPVAKENATPGPGRVPVEPPSTVKRVGGMLSGAIKAGPPSRVVSGGATAMIPGSSKGEGEKTVMRPGRVMLSTAAAAAAAANGPLKAGPSKAPPVRSVAPQPSSKASFLPPPSGSLRPSTLRKTPHSSSESSTFSEFGMASPSSHRTPRATATTLPVSTLHRPPSAIGSPTTVRPVRSLAAFTSSTIPFPSSSSISTIRRPPSAIGRGPPPSVTSTARKVSAPAKPAPILSVGPKSSTTSTHLDRSTPPRVASSSALPPPSSLRAVRPPPLKRQPSAIPVSAVKGVREMKKASVGPSVEDLAEEEADDERPPLGRKRSVAGLPTAAGRTILRPRDSLLVKKEGTSPGKIVLTARKGKEVDRRESWETLPPSSRPSLGGVQPEHKRRPPSTMRTNASLRLPHPSTTRLHPPTRPEISLSATSPPPDEAGDQSWETIDPGHRLSSLSFATPPSKVVSPSTSVPFPSLDAPADALLLTSPPHALLPARTDISYLSPDPSALRRALHHHLAEISVASPALLGRPRSQLLAATPRGTRDSATLEEVLRMSLRGRRAEEVDDEEWNLCDEGVSVSMRKEMEGMGTPWRRSVVAGPSLGIDDLVREDEEDEALEVVVKELEEVRERAERAEREAEEARDELETLRSDKAAREFELREELERRDEEQEEARRELARARQATLLAEGEMEEERMRFERELALRPVAVDPPVEASDLGDPSTDQIGMVQGISATKASFHTFSTLADAARDERDVLRSEIEALRILTAGVGVWDAVVFRTILEV